MRAWTGAYLRQLMTLDYCAALAAGWLAFQVRFGDFDTQESAYILLGLALPLLWLAALELVPMTTGFWASALTSSAACSTPQLARPLS
jgi:hypothetical protein